ncbi:MAG: TIGR03960 family B12-binding radical SAM protein [Firmicutes bacterium]|uniref:TIGR03960 family B12-binding radical SAM protein n=1 Tax=Candidatus Scybalomonas excrementavium TaxID=2840943 RepID=A0A9D9N7B3_9FIRM|nr:TIGR03960 family B12-binding radical SAM protein [Candidatus Scybalomonas excrementavium]
MRKLALDDEILLTVEKPARYIGNEINMVVKDKAEIDVRFAMCFPDVYEIGMSHLGIQILYDMFNRREDVWCERVYSPWPDLDKIMRERQIPLFGLESQEPIKEFDFLGITIQYEMCYTNILQVLDLSQIPIYSKERTDEHPIVIGGGPCTYNPEPLADFFDLFYIGEGETIYFDLIDLYKKMKAEGKSRQEFIKEAGKMEGIYAPSMYEVTYHEDGTVKSFDPIDEDMPRKIRKQIVMDVSHTYYPEKPLVPYMKVTQDRVVLEIQRGCIRGCRFCQAGQIYRPVRERDVNMLKDYAIKMLKNTGQDEITLSSLSSSDYSGLKELTYFLLDECQKKKINISLPSLRIDEFSLDVMSRVQDVKKGSMTFAPEAGSQRMRDVINKGLTKEDILTGAVKAFKGGWTRVKLYFMLGLPTETEEDIKDIAHLAEDIAMAYYRLPAEDRHGRISITASASFFIPKPFTPLQWATMVNMNDYKEKAHIVNDEMKAQHNRKSLKFQWHDAKTTILEGVFARGDRRLCKSIYDAYKAGCIYDAWTEHFQYETWLDVFEKNQVDVDFYTTRERDLEEIFPWDFIDIGVTKEYLKREWIRATQNQVITPNCRQQCVGCGAKTFGGGVCYEGKN